MVDAGDIVYVDDDMEACQKMFSMAISDLLNKTSIALGGGARHGLRSLYGHLGCH